MADVDRRVMSATGKRFQRSGLMAPRRPINGIKGGMTKRPSACPAPDCSVANPVQLEASERLIAAGVEDDWVRKGRRCSACGCVYILNGVTKVIKGHLD